MLPMGALLKLALVMLLIEEMGSSSTPEYFRMENWERKREMDDKVIASGHHTIIGSFLASSLLRCGVTCQTNIKCLSFFWNKAERICQMNNATLQAMDSPGYFLYQGFAFYQAKAVLECGSAPDLPDATWVQTGKSVGSRVDYSCLPDFLFEGTKQSSVCTADGFWEGLDGGCLQMTWRNLTKPVFQLAIPTWSGYGMRFNLSVATKNDKSSLELLLGSKVPMVEAAIVTAACNVTGPGLAMRLRNRVYGVVSILGEMSRVSTQPDYTLCLELLPTNMNVYMDDNLTVSSDYGENASGYTAGYLELSLWDNTVEVLTIIPIGGPEIDPV